MQIVTVKPPSFTIMENGTTNFWSPERTGEYEVQCARGRAYAQELIEFIRDEQNPVYFGSVMRAVQAAGKYDGVEIGFFSRLGIELLGLVG